MKPSRISVGIAGLVLGAGAALGGNALADSGSQGSSSSSSSHDNARSGEPQRDHQGWGDGDRWDRHGPTPAQRQRMMRLFKQVAGAAGATPDRLMQQLSAGKTMTQIAASNGVSRASLLQRLDQIAATEIARLVDQKMPMRPMMHPDAGGIAGMDSSGGMAGMGSM